MWISPARDQNAQVLERFEKSYTVLCRHETVASTVALYSQALVGLKEALEKLRDIFLTHDKDHADQLLEHKESCPSNIVE